MAAGVAVSLDLFPQAVAASDQYVAGNAAQDVPAGFSEALDASWRAMTEWHSSTAYEAARERALASFYDDVKARTGEQLPLYGLGGGVSLDDLNAGIAALRERRPDDGFMPLSEADIDTMARRRMAAAHDGAASLARRETTWGGTAGNVIGTLAGALTDPVMLATLPLGGAGQAGIALRTLEFAAIAGGTEAATAAMNYSQREAAVPGSSKEIPGEIAAATLFGGAFGLGFGALQKLLGAGAKPLPTATREEVNAATSEAQRQAVNPFPTVAGEAAARDAETAAAKSMLAGERVTAGEAFQAAHVADYAAAAKADTPEALAAAGERHLRPETYLEVPNVERFDPIPMAAEDAASYWERRLLEATPEERAALGATDTPVEIPTISVEGRAFADTRGTGIKLHGSSKTEIVFDEGHYSTLNYYGQGFYTTDAADVAYGYSKRGAKNSGQRNLYQIEEKSPVKLLDAEQPLTPEIKAILTQADGRDEYVSQAIEAGAKNVRQIYDEIRDIATADGNSADEIQEVFDAMRENLVDAGYRGMTHLGGLRTNTKAHSVTIYFRPEDDLIAKKIGFDQFEAKSKAADDLAALPANTPQEPRIEMVAARDLRPDEVTKLAGDPKTSDAVQRNLDRIRVERPEAEYVTQIKQPDGSYQLVTRKLEDVLDEIDAEEALGQELMACATGMMAAE